MVFPNRSIGDFNMTSMTYINMLASFKYNKVGPRIHNKAIRRTHHLELFMHNNPKWFDSLAEGKRVISQVQGEVSTWPDEHPSHYGSFVRPRCVRCLNQ